MAEDAAPRDLLAEWREETDRLSRGATDGLRTSWSAMGDRTAEREEPPATQ